MATPRDSWLLVTVTTAGAPATLRVTVWRKLKALGALYLQQSVCLLPALPAVGQELDQLTQRVNSEGGAIRVLAISVTDLEQDAALRAELRAARDAEYGEVLERLPAFFAELEMETARGRTTFEEVEESEADLARFRSWLAKIDARNYFDAPHAVTAHQQLTGAEEAMRRFTEQAMAADEPLHRPRSPSRRLRSARPPGDAGHRAKGC